jgi:plasmid stabilization system protein ParE
MDNNSIIWSDRALFDLNSILEYINQNSGKERANHVLKGIEATIKQIYPFPYIFAKEPTINDNNIRYIVKWSYKIIYEIFENHIEIDHIFHSSQDPSKLIKQ